MLSFFTILCFPTERAFLPDEGPSGKPILRGTGQVHQHVFDIWAKWEAYISNYPQRTHKTHPDESVLACTPYFWSFFWYVIVQLPKRVHFIHADPDISPVDTLPPMDPSVFQKRYLRKMRDLGEVSSRSNTFLFPCVKKVIILIALSAGTFWKSHSVPVWSVQRWDRRVCGSKIVEARERKCISELDEGNWNPEVSLSFQHREVQGLMHWSR